MSWARLPAITAIARRLSGVASLGLVGLPSGGGSRNGLVAECAPLVRWYCVLWAAVLQRVLLERCWSRLQTRSARAEQLRVVFEPFSGPGF